MSLVQLLSQYGVVFDTDIDADDGEASRSSTDDAVAVVLPSDHYGSDASLTHDYLPIPDFSTTTFHTLVKRRFRRPEILDKELLVPEGPSAGSLMDRVLNKLSSELISRVLAWLHPMQLVFLSYMTKTLRDLLESNSTIWKTARARFPFLNVPDPVPGTTEEQWALLVFTDDCFFCEQQATTTVWMLRVKLCNECMKLRLLPISRVPRPPEMTKEDWRLVLQLSFSCKDRYAALEDMENPIRSCLQHDVVRVTSIIQTYHRRILGGSSDALSELKTFCESRLRDLALIGLQWHGHQNRPNYTLHRRIRNLIRQQRYDFALVKLRAAGYVEKDIRVALTMNPVVVESDIYMVLDDDEWGTFEPTYVPLVKRIWRERRATNFFSPFLRDFAKTSYGLTPPAPAILAWTVVTENEEFVEMPSSADRNIWDKYEQQILKHVEIWRQNQNSAFVRKTFVGAWAPRRVSSAKDLELATVVFKCTYSSGNGQPVWFHDLCLGKHPPCNLGDSEWTCLQYDPVTSQQMPPLIEAAGLDPTIATTKHLDSLTSKHRFFCLQCKVNVSRQWRDCVSHLREHKVIVEEGEISPDQWKLLSPALLQSALALEVVSLKKTTVIAFCCRLCDAAQAVTWRDLMQHMHNKHSKTKATVLESDYEFDASVRVDPVTLPKKIVAAESQPMLITKAAKAAVPGKNSTHTTPTIDLDVQFKCVRCQTSHFKAARRLFAFSGLCSHLASKHHVLTISPSDYIDVTAFDPDADDLDGSPLSDDSSE